MKRNSIHQPLFEAVLDRDPEPVEGIWVFFWGSPNNPEEDRAASDFLRRYMAQNRQNQFIKRRKELDRKRKAMEKMEKRLAKKKRGAEPHENGTTEQSPENPTA